MSEKTGFALEKILNMLPDASVVVNGEGVIVMVNRQTEEIFGYARDELLGQPVEILMPGRFQNSHVHHRSGYMTEPRVRSMGSCVGLFGKRKDGSEFPVDIMLGPVEENGETLVIATVRDITARQKIEDSLRETNARLEDALNRLQESQQRVIQQQRLHALGQMASGIAHDFNNALSPIVGFSELLLIPDGLNDGEKTKHYLEMINTSAHDAAEIVKRLREFYRPRDENEEHYPANLKSIIEQVIAITQPKWKNQLLARGITIQIKTDFQVVPEMTCDEHEMRELFTNLIFNAVDAMPQCGTITIRTRMEQYDLVIEVSDTGVGMTEEIRKRCFEPFFSTKGSEGTGLGLSMVYGIIQRHGGTLEIESEPGKGTTVILRCPQKTNASSDLNENKRQAAEQPLRPLHILVVDDEPAVRMVIVEYLSMDEHVVETACDGKEALEKFFAGYFDLVISDRSMPEMSGDQLAFAVKKEKPEVPFILLTGFGDLMNAADEHPEGVDIIVSKPVTRQALRDAILNVVSG